MTEDSAELLNTFIKLNLENQAYLLACFRSAYAAQENVQAMRDGSNIESRNLAGSGRLQKEK